MTENSIKNPLLTRPHLLEKRKYTQSCSDMDHAAGFSGWHSLSEATHVKPHLSTGIDKSNQSEWRSTIKEEDEKTPLIVERSRNIYCSIDTLAQSLIIRGPAGSDGQGIGWLSIAFGLANASIGVGVLNYPAVYDKIGGIQYATVVQLLLVLIIMLSMAILIYCADLSRATNYHEVLSNICGKRAEILVALDITLATYGICIAYLIIIGDQYDRIFASYFGVDFCRHWYLDRRFTIAVTALFIAPLCFMKKLDFLRHTGPLGIISMLYVVLLTIYQHYSLTDVVPGEVKTRPDSVVNVLAVIPVMCFGYQCNEVVVPMYASMKERTGKSFSKAAVTAWSTLFVLYGAVGYFGYVTFGSKVLPDIIQMFNAKDPFVMLGICALIFKMAVTYPQMSFVGRGSLDGLYAYCSKKDAKELIATERRRRYVSTTLWFISTLLLGLFAPDIGIVIEAIGSLSVANVFIFPSICLICLYRRKDLGHGQALKTTFLVVASVLLVIGVVVSVLVVYQVYIDLLNVSENGSAVLCSV